MAHLLLSDLHLPAKASPLRDAFAAFIEGPALKAESVYLLGDIFEYWIGDDAGLQTYAREVAALAALTVRGVPVYFMHGNRDFLVGDEFAQITGATLLHDPHRVDFYGIPTLLSHGDVFCTDDVGYQRWRRFSRNPLAQWIYRRLPRARREKIAGGLRSQSSEHKRYKAEDIMDVNAGAIRKAFDVSGARRLIHGHTHRPAEHRDEMPGSERIVLADWRPERREYLSIAPDGWQRVLL